MQEYTAKEKETLVKQEEDRLMKIFKGVDENQLGTVLELIHNAAFMKVTLQILQSAIHEKGPVDRYQNGANQFGFKKSPEVEAYNSTIKNFTQVVKLLYAILPVDFKSEQDELLKFIGASIR